MILKRCRIVGTWLFDRKGTGLDFTLRPFGGLAKRDVVEAERLCRRMVRFPDMDTRSFVVDP